MSVGPRDPPKQLPVWTDSENLSKGEVKVVGRWRAPFESGPQGDGTAGRLQSPREPQIPLLRQQGGVSVKTENIQ